MDLHLITKLLIAPDRYKILSIKKNSFLHNSSFTFLLPGTYHNGHPATEMSSFSFSL